MSSQEELLHQVTVLFVESMPPGYDLLDAEAEKHGSWEWVAKRHDSQGLNRFLLLSITHADALFPEILTLEVRAGADNGRHFWQGLIWQERVSPLFFLDENLARPSLRAVMPVAAKRAEALQQEDLTESYLRPMESPGLAEPS